MTIRPGEASSAPIFRLEFEGRYIEMIELSLVKSSMPFFDMLPCDTMLCFGDSLPCCQVVIDRLKLLLGHVVGSIRG